MLTTCSEVRRITTAFYAATFAIALFAFAPPAHAAAPLAISGLQQKVGSPAATISEGQNLYRPELPNVPVTFSAPVPAGRSVKLEVQLNNSDIFYASGATRVSGIFNSGTASVQIGVFQTPAGRIYQYHWKARFIDALDPMTTSPWVAFGDPAKIDFWIVGKPEWTLEQHAITPSNDAIALTLGAPHDQPRVRLSAIAKDYYQMRIEVELKKKAAPYDGLGTVLGNEVGFGRTSAYFSLPSSATENEYKWRARLVDPEGLVTTPWWEFGSTVGATEGKTAFVHPRSSSVAPLVIDSLSQKTAYTLPNELPEGKYILDTYGEAIPFFFSALAPAGRAVKIEVEVKKVGTSFTGTGTQISGVSNTGTATIEVPVTSAAPGKTVSQKWRARLVDVVHPEITSAWKEYGVAGNADFTFQGEASHGLPALYSISASGAATEIVDATSPTRRIRISADFKNDYAARLEVELKRKPLHFDGLKTKTSALVKTGTASVTYDLVEPVVPWGDAYIWRARLVNAAGVPLTKWQGDEGDAQYDGWDEQTDFFYGTTLDEGLIALRQYVGDFDGYYEVKEGTKHWDSYMVGIEQAASGPATIEFELKPFSEPFTGTATEIFDVSAGNRVLYLHPRLPSLEDIDGEIAIHVRARLITGFGPLPWRYVGSRLNPDFYRIGDPDFRDF